MAAAVTGSAQPQDRTAVAVAGLARELEGLRRTVDPLRALDDRVDHLARLVNQLADTLTALSARPAVAPAPTWLLLPADEQVARRVLDELVVWLAAVYLCYPDAAGTLPECWCWHPDLVEELLWLMHAWLAAYQGVAASVAAAGDWHDRLRPGVVPAPAPKRRLVLPGEPHHPARLGPPQLGRARGARAARPQRDHELVGHSS
jgi:hypothetical protein